MKSRRLLVVLTSLALLLSATASSTFAATLTSVGTQKIQTVKKLGTTRIVGTAAKPVAADPLHGEARPDPDESQEELEKLIHGSLSAARVPSSHVPRPAVLPVVSATSTFHLGGLNHFDQRFAGTGAYTNTQFSLEPPDQALCVGNGYVVESVNTVIRVRNSSGSILGGGAMPLNQFFGLAPEIIRATPLVFGDFTSDPKCYYDDATDRWFVTLLQISVDPPTGNFLRHSKVLIAVSTSGDPTGTFNRFSIDTTNDGSGGTPNHSGCPCFGDQPLIGADANGFYVTTNEFPIFTAGFHGAMVYAMSKAALVLGTLGTVVSIHEPTLAEGQAYSLQPATTPPGARFATANGGTEYFLSALEFTGGLDNRIALWSLTNTSSLASTSPTIRMQLKVVDSEVYGAPPAMIQKDGLTPLRDLIKSPLAPAALGIKSTTESLPLLNSNDDRMNQAVYVAGKVWGALNTVVKSPTGASRTAIAWFAVTPAFSGSTLGGAVSAQGYIAIQNNNVAFPAIAANAAGSKVIVGFSLVGPDYFPSAAYATLSPAASNVKIVSAGAGPADGFTGYPSEDPGNGGVERWGDYSAAATDESGNLWFATESINQACSLNTFLGSNFTCGNTRTILANWGTTIAKVAP
ncbi:MAG: hypothetical protein H0W81_08170 [Chloroflexi bacterium]|nr:hypothetical protein [Chloroflexota bacterium]